MVLLVCDEAQHAVNGPVHVDPGRSACSRHDEHSFVQDQERVGGCVNVDIAQFASGLRGAELVREAVADRVETRSHAASGVSIDRRVLDRAVRDEATLRRVRFGRVRRREERANPSQAKLRTKMLCCAAYHDISLIPGQ